MFRPLLCVVVSMIAVAPASAQLTGTLTNGNATFTQTSTPSSITSTAMRATFRPEGGATTNNLYDQWMFYRVAGDTRERAFGNYGLSGGITTNLVGNYSGSTATYNLTDSNSGGTRFTANWTMNLVDGAVANDASLNHSVTVSNPGATPLTISIFQYVDIDLNSIPGGQSANGGLGGMFIEDGVRRGSLVPGVTPNAFQVTAYSALRGSLLNGTVTNLDNTGLPFNPGDGTFAYQWDLTIPAGQSANISSTLRVQPVPEPSLIFACCIGLAGLGRVYAKRRKVVA